MEEAGSGMYFFHFIGQDILWPLQKEWRSGKHLDMCSSLKKNGLGEQLASTTATAKNNENTKHY